MDNKQSKLKTKLTTGSATTFQPIQIGTQTSIEKDFQHRFEGKIKRFDALYSYLLKFIPLEDKNVLKRNIYEYFLKTFLDKEQGNFPPNAPITSILQFMQVDTNKIQLLINDFEAIEFNLEAINLNTPELPIVDFGIYTETIEQNDLYFKLIKVVTAISELEATGKTIYKSPLLQSFNFMLHYDLTTQKLTPNAQLILGKTRGY